MLVNAAGTAVQSIVSKKITFHTKHVLADFTNVELRK